MTNRITVVACHYRLPEKRLRDFLKWNDGVFRKFGVTVHIVSDVPRDNLPDYVKILIFPTELKIYSPARVSNFGIRSVGQGIVCKTDIDCVFSEVAMQQIANVGVGHGIYFCYMMAKSYETRQVAVRWGSTSGTMALHFDDWSKICGYDERQEGYGVEDGDGVARARKIADVKKIIDGVWHIAHTGEELWTQTNVCLRRDLWNRKSGFCPDRHSINRRIRDNDVPWNNQDWGKGIDAPSPFK